jgi:hypothetical protein
MRLIAGAYPAAPADPAEFLDHLATSDLIGGLELPFVDDERRWSLDRLPAHWVHVVTAVPATALRARTEAGFGLASTDEDGRREALAVTLAVRDAVERVTQSAGRALVMAVELHSPPQGSGTADQFARSLEEAAGWDWSGARLVVEHCDAPVAAHPPEKGYLSLPDELTAVREVGADIGVVINWGRSVIEAREPAGAVAHVTLAREAGLLAGVMFSGVAAEPIGDVPAWADAHLAPAPGHPASLLTAAHVTDCVNAAGEVDYLGVKVGARPTDTSAADRANGVLEALRLVSAALRNVGATD